MAGDDGTHLHISDSMARDLDSGRADNRTLDDFLPDHALQEIKDYTDSQSVVHGEDLVPISRADAAARTRFDGETMPGLPKTRRVIPAPYRRDRLTGGKHGKRWREITAETVRPGDIITGLGRVTRVQDTVRHEGTGVLGPVAVGTDVHVWGGDGNYQVFDSLYPVRVFR